MQRKRFNPRTVDYYGKLERLRCLAQERRFAQVRLNKRNLKAGLQFPCENRNNKSWKAPAGPEGKKATQDFQKSEIAKSIAYLRNEIGLGLKA